MTTNHPVPTRRLQSLAVLLGSILLLAGLVLTSPVVEGSSLAAAETADSAEASPEPQKEEAAAARAKRWQETLKRLDADSLGEVQPGGYTEDFPNPANIRASGIYDGERAWDFESFSALELEPSRTSTFEVFKLGQENEVVIDETEPGLLPNTNAAKGEPFYKRGKGAISALGWTDDAFTDVRVNAIVNSEGGPEHKGAKSRQGVIARWNDGNLYYWFYVDFVSGKYEILRSEGLGIFKPFLESTGDVKDFDNRRQYFLNFEVVGSRLRGRVFEVNRSGVLGRQVGDTGTITDRSPLPTGLTGFLVELSLGAPYEPLEGSVARIAATPLSRQQPQREQRVMRADVRKGRELTREGLALGRQGKVKESVAALRRAVEANANAHRALTGLAWIHATSDDPGLRDPEESLALATRAFDALMQDFNRKRESVEPADFVRTANALAAANAALGNFTVDPISQRELEQRAIQPAEGLTMDSVLQAVADSGELEVALTWSQFALEVVSGMDVTTASERSLVDSTRQVFEQVSAGQAVAGMPVQ